MKKRAVSCKSQSAGSLDNLRDAIIVAHGMASGNYAQTDMEMRRRIERLLEKTIRADPAMRDFLGWEENDKMRRGEQKLN